MRIIVIVSVVISVFVVFYLGFSMRKSMPYDFEIVPQNGGFVIINTTPWADQDCDVTVEGVGEKYTEILPSDKKYYIFRELKNGQKYKITISRKDFLGKIKYRPFQSDAIPHQIEKYVVLVGASVGKAWNLRELSERKKLKNIFVGYRGKYEFNKGSLIDSILKSPLKPTAVILKECAAYFPRDVDSSIEKIKKWVVMLKSAGIEPILATVVPITQSRDSHDPSTFKSLCAYNNLLKKFGAENNIKILDLQKALSDNSGERYLDNLLAASDGLHLNTNAYRERLDPLILRLITDLN